MGYNNLGVSDPGSVISGLGAASAVGGAIGGPGAGIGGTSITPDQLAILLSALGKGLSPDNPMAGVGAAAADFSKSRMTNVAREQERNDTKEWRQQVIKALGLGFTEPGTAGLNSRTTKTGKDGGPDEHTITYNTENANVNPAFPEGGQNFAPF